MSRRRHPVLWILHEWWDDTMIVEAFALRNIANLTLDTVKTALKEATMVVFVCDAQKKAYSPTAESDVVFIGVPDPFGRNNRLGSVCTEDDISPHPSRSRSNTQDSNEPKVFTFLCLGVVCPRKNQCWTVEVFKEWANRPGEEIPNVRLVVVGARRTRKYEVEYLEQLQALIGDAANIELHDVTTDVDRFFSEADCLVITSLNEVTPMVISEAFAYGIPVISTNIAGIPDMMKDGKEGYLFSPGDKEKAIFAMDNLYRNVGGDLRSSMSKAARQRFESTFDVELMVAHYRRLINKVAPPVVLIDLDGTLVDWDKGFNNAWAALGHTPPDRKKSYFMEKCVGDDDAMEEKAIALIHSQGFFRDLPPMEGALAAVREMMSAGGLCLYICTSPIKTSQYCAQEKIEWMREHLGEEWLSRIIICQDKTEIRGDILIDDKPAWTTPNTLWKHVVFDAPYNRHLGPECPRLNKWSEWLAVLPVVLGSAKDTYDCTITESALSVDGSDEALGFFKHSRRLWNSFKHKLQKTSLARGRNDSKADLLMEEAAEKAEP